MTKTNKYYCENEFCGCRKNNQCRFFELANYDFNKEEKTTEHFLKICETRIKYIKRSMPTEDEYEKAMREQEEDFGPVNLNDELEF